MKRMALALCISFLLTVVANGQQVIDGYIVTAAKDTVRTKIEVPKMHDNTFYLFDKVTVQDSAGNETSYKAGKQKIKGFGFVYNETNYDYHLWKTGNEYIYAVKLRTGKTLSLSFYYNPDYTGMPRSYPIYLLEDANKKSVSVSPGLFTGMRPQLRKFFAGNTQVLSLLNAPIDDVTGLLYFVDQVNTL